MVEYSSSYCLFINDLTNAILPVSHRVHKGYKLKLRALDLDGVEITRRLKSQSEYATVPIVMITGQSAREVVAASLQAGAVDFVVKPFEREILLRKVEKYLGV